MICRALLYHDVVESAEHLDSSGFAGASADAYKIDRSNFESHLDTVKSWQDLQGTDSVVVGGLFDSKEARKHQVIFTFDDAGASSITIADLLERRGWRGSFFVPTDFIGVKTFLTRVQVRNLVERGHCVGSHSASHPLRMADLGTPKLLEEWRTSRAILQDITGREISVASVPGGFYSVRVCEAAKAVGYEILFNSEPVSRPTAFQGMTVCGRYSIMRNSSVSGVLAICKGRRLTMWQRRAFWNTKTVLKKIIGPASLKIRDTWFGNRRRK